MSFKGKIEVRFEQSFLKRGFDIWIGEYRDETGTFQYVKPFELELSPPHPEYLQAPEATLFLPTVEATHFFEAMAAELRRHGYDVLKPANVEGEVKAMKYHLEDMRNLVFKGKK